MARMSGKESFEWHCGARHPLGPQKAISTAETSPPSFELHLDIVVRLFLSIDAATITSSLPCRIDLSLQRVPASADL